MKKSITTMVGCALAMLNLVGCQSNQYVPPQLPLGSAATIVGSDNAAGGGSKAVPSEIDGKYLSAYGQRDAQAIISPGPHSINVLVETKASDRFGVATLSMVAQPANAYVIRASDPVPVTKECATSFVWIEKQNGELLTERVPISLVVFRGGTSFMVGSTFVSVPGRSRSCH